MAEGLQRFDLWLKDLVRSGLGTVESKPASFWEDAARRLVDAQAPGLASRVARLASIPRSSPDWPARLLAELGRFKLLVAAWQRLGELPPPLQSDIRQLLGWTVSQEELQQTGQRVDDTWLFVGQWTDDDGRLRTQRTWVLGRSSGKVGLVLQFAPGDRPFAESILPGIEQEGTMVFYPGAAGQRARILERRGSPEPIGGPLPGFATIEAFLASVAEDLARQPWLDAFGGVLQEVTVVPHHRGWFIRDRLGQGLPLRGGQPWPLLAVAGGQPFDLAGEWDGHQWRPLGFFCDRIYQVLA